MCCSICFANEHGCCEHVEAYENVAKRMQKYNLEGDIEVLSKEAKVIKEMIKHKEQTIRETDARKETILTNVSTEIEKLKSKLDECQQQFKKTFLKTHEKLKQCVLDLKQYLVTVQNGQALLSAVQQHGSVKQAFLAALKTITDVEEQFNYFKKNYLKDEESQYEHDHTTILWQVCNHLKILDVTLVPSPSMIMWNLSLHLSSFGIHEQKQPSTLFQNLTDPNLLKLEKKSEFPMSGSPHQAIFVNTETIIIACSFPPYLKAAKTNGAMDSFEYPIKLNGKPCLCSGPTRDVFSVSCLSSIYKLKIAYKRKSVIDSTCMAEFKVTENFDVFCVDEAHNRIIVASKANVTIFTLSPILDVQTTNIKCRYIGCPFPFHGITNDRTATVIGGEVFCFTLSGEFLFRRLIPGAMGIRCVTLDALNNVYGVCIFRQGCGKFDDSRYRKKNPYYYFNRPPGRFDIEAFPCDNCRLVQNAHVDSYHLFQILNDGRNSRILSSYCPNTMSISVNEISGHLVLSDGSKITVYKL